MSDLKDIKLGELVDSQFPTLEMMIFLLVPQTVF